MPALARDYFVIAPDQRGFGGSDKPEGVEWYKTDRILEDLIALADALELDRFTLVGHDWGGAVAWLAALRHPDRIKRLVIVNAPHPLIFQKSLIEDEAQRAASQYMNAFRNPGMEAGIAAMGWESFYDEDLRRPCRSQPGPARGEGRLSRRLVRARRADRDAELVPGERDRRAAGRRGGGAPRLDPAPLPAPRHADARHLGARGTRPCSRSSSTACTT